MFEFILKFFLIIYSSMFGYIFASCIQYKYSIKESLQLALLWPLVALVMLIEWFFHV